MAYSPDYIRGWLAGHTAAEKGRRWRDYLAGWEDRARLEREATEAEWEGVRDVVARTLRTPSYADLAETRGEPRRAERQRQILAQRGVVA